MNKYALDSSAWLEYFTKPSQEIIEIIESGNVITSIIAIAEICDKLIQNEKNLDEVIVFIKIKSKIIDLSIDISVDAAKIKKKVRKTRPKFGLADAIHLATARSQGAIFVTKDNDFSELDSVKILK